MKFERFVIHQVRVPAHPHLLAAHDDDGVVYKDNLSWPDLPICLVEGFTDQGIRALGEVPRGILPGDFQPALEWLLHRPLEAVGGFRELDASYGPISTVASQNSPPCFPGLVEMLWLDAVGQRAGLSVAALLGGAVRSEVEVDYWANRPDAKALSRIIKEADQLGLKGVKLKSNSRADTAHALLAIVDELPEGFHVTIDPMNQWHSLARVREVLGKLAESGVNLRLEDPFAAHWVEDWKRIQSWEAFLVVAHVRSDQQFCQLVRDRNADVLNLAGATLRQFLERAAWAACEGFDCWQGSAIELGVFQAFRLHAAAVAANCRFPSDLCSGWVRESTVTTPPMAIRNGLARLPDSPGLGVDLDQTALKKYRLARIEIPG